MGAPVYGPRAPGLPQERGMGGLGGRLAGGAPGGVGGMASIPPSGDIHMGLGPEKHLN